MQDTEERVKKLSAFYFWLAVIGFFLMALLQGLHRFFFVLFFWPAIGFSILALYYWRAAKMEEQSNTVHWQQDDASSSEGFSRKRAAFMIGASAVVLFAILSSVIFSKKQADSSLQETVQTDEPQSSDKNDQSAYDQAYLEFHNRNYRQSIAIARKAIDGNPTGYELMLVLGDDYGALKQNDSCLIWFDRAYQNGARSAYLSHWLGYLYDDKGNISTGIQFYKDALKQDSTRTQLYDRLAELEPERADWYRKKSAQWAEKK